MARRRKNGGSPGAFVWAPDDEFLRAFAGGGFAFPEEVSRMLLTRRPAGAPDSENTDHLCVGRSTEWLTHRISGVPYRITVVAPPLGGGGASPARRGSGGAGVVTDETLRAAKDVFVRLLGAIDSASVRRGGESPEFKSAPERPSSIDLVVLLWDNKKGLPEAGASIDPVHVNTGVCTRYRTGKTLIVVFRKEEATKTIAHEIFHAYKVGHWCNGDPEVLTGSDRIVRACLGASDVDLRVPSDIKPEEAVVDALAIDLCRRLFGGSLGEAEILTKARVAARRLVAHFYTLPESASMQSTPAAEYYLLKYHLLLSAEDLRKAHSQGLQRPDKKAVRKLFSAPPPVSEFLPRTKLPIPKKGLSMRMTPEALTKTLSGFGN